MSSSPKWILLAVLALAALPLIGCDDGELEPVEPVPQEDIVPVES